MSEAPEIGKERGAEQRGPWGSSWEYEDCRSLRKRSFAEPAGLHAENDLDSTCRARGRNRPYRKRDCGYWDFEQSEPNYIDSGETNGRGGDGLFPEDYAGYKNREDIDRVHVRPGTEEPLLLGSPPGILEAGECWMVNGCADYKDLVYNPEDTQKAKHRNSYRDLGDSLRNLHQPHDWYWGLGNCKGISLDCGDHHTSRHVPGPYTNGESVEPPDWNGIGKGEEFVRYCEDNWKVCQSSATYPRAKTYPSDLANFNTENKSADTFSPNPEPHDCRQVDSLHPGEDLLYHDSDRLGMRALGGQGAVSEGVQQQPGGEQGEHHFGIHGGPVLESTWHLEEERRLAGSDTWRRNSHFRRTAPSTLRRSEFMQRRKNSQGRNPARPLAVKIGDVDGSVIMRCAVYVWNLDPLSSYQVCLHETLGLETCSLGGILLSKGTSDVLWPSNKTALSQKLSFTLGCELPPVAILFPSLH